MHPALAVDRFEALLAPVLAAITITPDPVAFRIGSIPIYWYGIAYAVGLALAYRVLIREARWRGFDTRHVDNGIVIVAIAALIGGRLYHVIDQWHLYQNDPITAILPVARAADGSLQFAGITGLGVYGGIFTGLLTVVVYTRWKHLPFWRWADVIAPALFVMQAVGRWGNFFNQELYGPPTTLPWGIAIDCQHRIATYPCADFPAATTAFHPLFLYESVSGILGAITLVWLARRFRDRLRPGDLALVFFIWYAVVRFLLEFLRSENWTLGGIPTAQIVSLITIGVAMATLVFRHRPGARLADADDVSEFAAHDEAELTVEADLTDDEAELTDLGDDGPLDGPADDAAGPRRILRGRTTPDQR